MRRIFGAIGHSDQNKTWDGTRWAFALLAAFFVLLSLWLAFHEHMLQHEAAALLLVPAGFAVALASLTTFASDQTLTKIFRWS